MPGLTQPANLPTEENLWFRIFSHLGNLFGRWYQDLGQKALVEDQNGNSRIIEGGCWY